MSIRPPKQLITLLRSPASLPVLQSQPSSPRLLSFSPIRHYSTPPPGFKLAEPASSPPPPTKPIESSLTFQSGAPSPPPRPPPSNSRFRSFASSFRLFSFKDPFAFQPPPGYVNPDPAWKGPLIQLSFITGILTAGLTIGWWISEKALRQPSLLREIVNWVVPGYWPWPVKRAKKRKPIESDSESGLEAVPRVDEEVVLKVPTISSRIA